FSSLCIHCVDATIRGSKDRDQLPPPIALIVDASVRRDTISVFQFNVVHSESEHLSRNQIPRAQNSDFLLCAHNDMIRVDERVDNGSGGGEGTGRN
ncbi:hypothetical protein PFISCL1PPCAC_20803, partial [Pristionchus fissidentatus]